MCYVGLREVIFYVFVRKNYGCMYFIVGCDYVGVGDYYGIYEVQELFDIFKFEEFGIILLKFEYSFFCEKCGNMGMGKMCFYGREYYVILLGIKVRGMLRDGVFLFVEFSCVEVVEVLIRGMKKKEEVGVF